MPIVPFERVIVLGPLVCDRSVTAVMPYAIGQLIEEVSQLLGELDAISEQAAETLRDIPSNRRRHAENMIHYAHLRTIDIRGVQNSLHDLGVTSLTTAESFTRGRLELALNVLQALEGVPSDIDVAAVMHDDEEADEQLDRNANTLFGEERAEVPARIMVTLPTEAADDVELVIGFAKAGMDLARINCAHDGPEVWLKMIDNVHTAAAAVGRDIGVSMDLAGPKLRTGAIEPGPRVGRARVTRDENGAVTSTAKLWLRPRPLSNERGDHVGRSELVDVIPAPAPAGLPGRPALPLFVDSAWLEQAQVGDVISLHDARSAKRHFTITQITDDGVLAEGEKNAYIHEGTLLRCNYEVTRGNGIPATVQKLHFNIGDELILTTVPGKTVLPQSAEDIPRISCSLTAAVAALKPGEPVLFDDGAIGAEVVAVEKLDDGNYDARLRVVRTKPGGQNLAAHKGINLPQTDLPLPSLTAEDEQHLRFVVEHADIAAVSFIRTAADVENVLDKLEGIAQEHEQAGHSELAERARHLGLVLKIETIPAFKNLPHIIIAGMHHGNSGLMIARGDLAVELGFDRMGEVPGQILTLAQSAGMPTILGTQVLENMAKSGLPSRAEITDAAFALRAECVMLNKGPHITEAIGILNHLASKVGRSQRKSRIMLRRIRSWDQ